MSEIKKHDCGCHHDHECDCHHEHDHECDCGCEEDVVVLYDDEGNELSFYHVATLDRDGKEYACLQLADDEDPVVEIFELEEAEEDGEPIYNFLPIEDELYEVLYAQLEQEVAELNGECHCDGDCHCHDDEE